MLEDEGQDEEEEAIPEEKPGKKASTKWPTINSKQISRSLAADIPQVEEEPQPTTLLGYLEKANKEVNA